MIIEMTSEKIIKSCIEQRIKDNDLTKASLLISPKSAYSSIYNDENIQKIGKLFEEIGVKSHIRDTVLGSFDLNRSWLETDYFDACVEYDGVYPVKMNPKDIAYIQDLDIIGEIRILAYIKEKDGTVHPNA